MIEILSLSFISYVS